MDRQWIGSGQAIDRQRTGSGKAADRLWTGSEEAADSGQASGAASVMAESRVNKFNVWMLGICFCLIFSGREASYDIPQRFLYVQGASAERYWRPFFDPKINLHKIFKNNNRLMKLSEIVYLYLDFTFSR